MNNFYNEDLKLKLNYTIVNIYINKSVELNGWP